jgi:hypothetical protein
MKNYRVWFHDNLLPEIIEVPLEHCRDPFSLVEFIKTKYPAFDIAEGDHIDCCSYLEGTVKWIKVGFPNSEMCPTLLQEEIL